MRPRIPIWCELVCCECSTTAAARFTYGAPGREFMRREAAKQGWLFKHDDCFCSRKCLDAYEKRLVNTP